MELAKINAIARNGLLCFVVSLVLNNLQDIRLWTLCFHPSSCGCRLRSQVTLLNETVHWGIKALEGLGGFEHNFFVDYLQHFWTCSTHLNVFPAADFLHE